MEGAIGTGEEGTVDLQAIARTQTEECQPIRENAKMEKHLALLYADRKDRLERPLLQDEIPRS